MLIELVESLNRKHYDISFVFEEYYKTDGDTSFGGDITYSHAWNDAGRFRLQVSLRERPTLLVVPTAMKHQAYFNQLEIELPEVRCLQSIEMIGEKVRRALSGPGRVRRPPIQRDKLCPAEPAAQ